MSISRESHYKLSEDLPLKKKTDVAY